MAFLAYGRLGIAFSRLGSGPGGSFTPASIPGLVAAWRPDQGVTTDVNGAASVAGAWGTTVSLTGAGTTGSDKPQIATALGPSNQDIFKFTKANQNRFTTSLNVVLTTCTAVWAVAGDLSTNECILGCSPANGNIRYPAAGGGGGAGLISVQATGGSQVNINCSGQLFPYKNFHIGAMTYDPGDTGGTAKIYLRNAELSGSAVIGGTGFTFNRVGCTQTSTNPFQGYMGPVLIYNQVLTSLQLTMLFTYLQNWRGNNIYVSSSAGNDSNVEYWNTTKPLLNRTTAIVLPVQGYESVLCKRGDIFRETAPTSAVSSGISASQRLTLGDYGAGNIPQIRCSIAPALTNTSGTIYSAAIATDPGIRFTGSITTTTLTASSVVGSAITADPTNGDLLIGAGVPANTRITAQLTGASGSDGTYTISASLTVGSVAMATAPATADHGLFVFYTPAGAITFGPNFTLGGASQNTLVNRLYRYSGTDQTQPIVGTYGWVGGTLYVNQGVALATGDIEVTVTGARSPISTAQTFWKVKNVLVAFSDARSFSNTVAGTDWYYEGCQSHFPATDGFDTDNAVTVSHLLCIATWAGTGYVSLGTNQGDGYSTHALATSSFIQCFAYWNGKSGLGHNSAAFATHDRCFAIGNAPFLSAGGTGGTYTMTNCIGVVPAEVASYTPHGAINNSTSNLFTIENCTLYSALRSGNGLFQNGSGGSYFAKNNIVDGFLTGLNFSGAGALTHDYNDYFNNGTNYTGASAAPHDIVLDPRLSNPATYDFSLLGNSPCIGAGVAIAGITTNYAGATRGNPPNIGAY